MSSSRRKFLQLGGLSALGLSALPGALAFEGKQLEKAIGSAKNVIFMVSDGMSSGTLTMADLLHNRLHGDSCNWIKLYQNGLLKRGMMDMASADSMVTDSAAASSSWGGGNRVNNGSINIGIDGEHYRPLALKMKAAGKAVGCVTSSSITHATPAGFTANVASREEEETIALQYLERQYDVMLGGGQKYFDKDQREDSRDLHSEAARKNLKVVTSRAQLAALPINCDKVIGLFDRGHLPFAIDRAQSNELTAKIPSLPEMSRVAIQKLALQDKGFFLMIEGGRVDHAAHDNDLGGLLYDQLAFDQTIKEVMKFAECRQDTLVIVATDHGNANPALNGVGKSYSETNQFFDRTMALKQSNNWILKGLSYKKNGSEIQDRVEAATNFKISYREAEMLQAALKGRYRDVYAAQENPKAVLGKIIANYTSVNWTGNNHTADFAELGTFGPGAELVPTFVRNTQMHEIILQACGIKESLQVRY